MGRRNATVKTQKSPQSKNPNLQSNMADFDFKELAKQIVTGYYIDFEAFVEKSDNQELAAKIVTDFEKSNLFDFLTLPIFAIGVREVIQCYATAVVSIGSISGTVNGVSVVINEKDMNDILKLPCEGMDSVDDFELDKGWVWKKISISEDETRINLSCHKKYLKDEFQKMMDIVAKSIEGKTGSFDYLTVPKARLMCMILKHAQFNWAKFIFERLVETVEKGRFSNGKFSKKMPFGLVISHLLSRKNIRMVSRKPIFSSQYMFRTQIHWLPETKKKGKEKTLSSKRAASKPMVPKQAAKKMRMAVSLEQSEESSARIPGDLEPTESYTEPPEDGNQTTVVETANVETEDFDSVQQKVMMWWSWKTERSRIQEQTIADIHSIEDMVFELLQPASVVEALNLEFLLAALESRRQVGKGKGVAEEDPKSQPTRRDDGSHDDEMRTARNTIKKSREEAVHKDKGQRGTSDSEVDESDAELPEESVPEDGQVDLQSDDLVDSGHIARLKTEGRADKVPEEEDSHPSDLPCSTEPVSSHSATPNESAGYEHKAYASMGKKCAEIHEGTTESISRINLKIEYQAKEAEERFQNLMQLLKELDASRKNEHKKMHQSYLQHIGEFEARLTATLDNVNEHMVSRDKLVNCKLDFMIENFRFSVDVPKKGKGSIINTSYPSQPNKTMEFDPIKTEMFAPLHAEVPPPDSIRAKEKEEQIRREMQDKIDKFKALYN
ncbi:hypothetical protein OROMI_001431 [Orobanche minor]